MHNIWAKDEKFLSAQDPKLRMKPHRRQFVVGPKTFRADDDWLCHQLDSLTWVSYCPELRVSWTKDADGGEWVLLGLAVETLESQADPLTEIAKTSNADIINLYASWAGRWVLIGRSQVHMDASGLLGCFYGKASNNKTWVSSSPTLLACILSPDAVPVVVPHLLRYQVGLSWFTPPCSRFAGIRRLLPSQVIELQDGSIQARSLMPPIDPSLSYDETLELLKHSLVTALKRLPIKESRLWLGLSSGVDSRLVFAMAHCADINIIPFTRLSARMSVADHLLPPKLAHDLGYGHVFLRGRNSNFNRQHLVAQHTGGHVSDGDAEPFMQSVRDSLEGISVGGWCFGVGKALGRKSLPDIINDPEIGTQQIAKVYGEPLNSTVMAGIRDWLEWIQKTPHEHLDWRDRFYIEQRLAGWQSSKEQLYDLTKIERIPIINAARNYALLLGIEEASRVSAKHQIDLISRTVPELSKYPCNPDNKYFGIFRAIATQLSHNPLYLYKKIADKLRWKLSLLS